MDDLDRPSTLEHVIAIALCSTGIDAIKLHAGSAIDQDLRIAGGDIIDFIDALAEDAGPQVREWPWHRFAILNEGLGCLFPFGLVWQLVTWPFRGSFDYPSPFERLELGHIAKAIDAGHWIEP